MSQNFERFGKYILLEKLASGGMAEVYLCKSTGAEGVNKFVAIKRILPQYSENPDFVEMFKEEAKIAVNLNHSNIVSIFDFGVERNQFYIVMDYLEGKNLRQIGTELKKQNRALAVDQIVYIIKEAAAGLDHAHRGVDSSTGKPLNIIHRDISPQNLMISYDGEVKVIDFGIAKAETQLEATKAGTLKGKYGYMSPEQADGQQIDSSTDIFSLGIVLWELLANDRLFTASSEAAILRKIRECQIPPIRKLNPSVPAELEKIVHKALARDKSLRYQTTASFHRDLNRFLNTAYPEFSPHDFAAFMKETFASEFLDIQRKRVEYSKVKFAENSESDKTLVGNTNVNLPPPPRPAASNEHTIIDKEDDGDVLNIDTSAAIKVDLGTMRTPKTGISVHTSSENQRSKTIVTQVGTKTGYHPNTKVGTTSIGKTPPRSPNSASLSGALTFAIVAFISAGGYFAWQKGFFKRATPTTYSQTQPTETRQPKNASSVNTTATPQEATPAPETVETTQLASTTPTAIEMVALTLYSENPTPDRILINGQDYGTSPVRTTVPRNMPVKIRFEKAGYEPYETEQVFGDVANSRHLKLPAENELIEVKIKPAVKIAGANLILINGKVPLKRDNSTFLVKLGKNNVEISDGFAIYGSQDIFVQKRDDLTFEIQVQGGNMTAIERLKRAYGK